MSKSLIRTGREMAFGVVLLAGLMPQMVLAEAGGPDTEEWLAGGVGGMAVYTNAGAESGLEIARELIRFRNVFARLSPNLDLQPVSPTTVVAFGSAESYAPYKTAAGPAGTSVLGQFLSRPDGTYITVDVSAHARGALSVIYHEYVHFFVRRNFPNAPLWFHEGLAEYYSTVVVEDASVRVGRPIARHLQRLAHSGEIDLERVIGMSGETPEHRNAGDAGRFYAASWILVHYLLSTEKDRSAEWAEYLARLSEGEDPVVAFERGFQVGLRELAGTLRGYGLQSRLPEATIPLELFPDPKPFKARAMEPAEVLALLGDLSVQVGRVAQGEDHFRDALREDGLHAGAMAGLAFALDMENRTDEAGVLYREALAQGAADDPVTLARFGRHQLRASGELRRQGKFEESGETAVESRALLESALDRFPRFAEVLATLGFAHLAPEGDPERGLTHIRAAKRLLPERADLVYTEVLLLLRKEEFDVARELTDRVLRRGAKLELALRADEEIERSELIAAANRAFASGEAERGLSLLQEAIARTSDAGQRLEMEEQQFALQKRLGRR